MSVHRPLLDAEEHDVRRQLRHMSDHTLTAVIRALEVVEKGDIDLAKTIIDDDEAINQELHKTEETCLITIATQQPVASDLRMIMSSSHIAGELERIADHAAGMARTLMNISEEALAANRDDILAMGKRAKNMVASAMDAYFYNDNHAARDLAGEDDHVDAMQDQLTAHLMAELKVNSAEPEEISRLLWVVHDLERMGDRALNIAERVVYMVEGNIIELNH